METDNSEDIQPVNDDNTKWVIAGVAALIFFSRSRQRSGSSGRTLPRSSVEPSPQTRADTPREEWWTQTYDEALQAAERFAPSLSPAQHRLIALSIAVLAAHETGQGAHEYGFNPGNLINASDKTRIGVLPGGERYAVFANIRTGIGAMVRLLCTASRYAPALRALVSPNRSITALLSVPEWAYSVVRAGYTSPVPRQTPFQAEIRSLTSTGQRILNVNDSELQPG